jgi:enoyl-CoA hydratase
MVSGPGRSRHPLTNSAEQRCVLFGTPTITHLFSPASASGFSLSPAPGYAAIMSQAEVLTRVEGTVGCLTLNRPEALHALNLSMCETMTAALSAWHSDPAVSSILIDHAGERGFCAGGDIRMIAASGAGDAVAARAFFHAEYRLNHLMFGYAKPIVAIVDGIVMGGGVGISEPADVRIATERTTYAMPETGIGLFPDVGGGWFLPRLPGEAGTWLALTGARLKAADTVALGIHTHLVPSGQIEAFKAELFATGPGAVDAHATEAGPAPLSPHRAVIDRVFSHDTVEAICAALEAEGSEWANAQLTILKTKSPRSLKVTLRQLRAGRAMTGFAEVMAMEYRLGGRVVRSHDFQEGVRAVIVDKDNAPRWSPAALEQVSDADIDALFAPLPADEEWSPLP